MQASGGIFSVPGDRVRRLRHDLTSGSDATVMARAVYRRRQALDGMEKVNDLMSALAPR